MRFSNAVVPALGYLSVANAALNFTEVYEKKPELRSTSNIKTTTKYTNTPSLVSSILSSLSSGHAATMIPAQVTSKTTTTSQGKTTLSTKKSSSSSGKASTTASVKQNVASSSSKKSSSSSSKKTSSSSSKKTSSTAKASASSSKHAARDVEERAVTSANKVVATTTSTSTTASLTTIGCTIDGGIMNTYTPTPNTPAQFDLDTSFANAALGALTPPAGYSTSPYVNGLASMYNKIYVGYHQLSTYNHTACAAVCDAHPECNAFNIYFERAPTFVTSNTCNNPPAGVGITCAMWGDYIDGTTAANFGQYRNDFVVLIAGSNGYNQNTPPAAATNYQGPTALVGAVVDNSHLLQQLFYTSYSASTCASACNAYTTSAKSSAKSNSQTSYTPCNYFNTFNVTLNGAFQGMYCQLFSTSSSGSLGTLTSTTQYGTTYNLTYSYGYALYPQDTGVTSKTWSAAPQGTAASCSSLGSVGSTLTDYNSATYTLGCGYDVSNYGDIGNAQATDFYSCMNLCDNFSGCSAFSYISSYQTCYFKNLTGAALTPQANSGVDMAWLPSKYSGFSASTIAATVTYTTTTTAWTGTVTTTITSVNGLTRTVIVETPGSVASNTGIATVTSAVDSGTASTIKYATVTPAGPTGTATVNIVYPTAVTTCGNAGVKFAMYSNYWPGYQATAAYPTYTPQVYKTVKPSATGVASYVGEDNPASGTVTIYGKSGIDATNLVLDHTFYIFAGRGTGWYTFQIPYADDIEFVWMGPTAVSGWTRSNAAIINYWPLTASKTLAYYLTFGTYFPVRIQWANGGGAGDLQFNIQAPDGSYMMYSTPYANSGTISGSVVTSPCNSTLGSAFPAWGSET